MLGAYVFAVVLLTGLTGVSSYFFQGKYKILLSAEGKTYVNTNIVSTIHIITSLTKALLLYMGYGVVAVQASVFVFNLVQMAVYYVYVKRHYPWIDLTVKQHTGHEVCLGDTDGTYAFCRFKASKCLFDVRHDFWYGENIGSRFV